LVVSKDFEERVKEAERLEEERKKEKKEKKKEKKRQKKEGNVDPELAELMGLGPVSSK